MSDVSEEGKGASALDDVQEVHLSFSLLAPTGRPPSSQLLSHVSLTDGL